MASQAGMFGSSAPSIDTTVSTTVFSVVDCIKNGPMGILHFPSTFAGATITFQVAQTSDGTFQTLQSGGSDVSVTVTVDKSAVLDPSIFYAVKYCKIVSASAEANGTTINIDHRAT